MKDQQEKDRLLEFLSLMVMGAMGFLLILSLFVLLLVWLVAR